jgi:hypothetical protein
MRPLIILIVIAVGACLSMPPRPGPEPPGVDAFVPQDSGSGSGFDAAIASPDATDQSTPG